MPCKGIGGDCPLSEPFGGTITHHRMPPNTVVCRLVAWRLKTGAGSTSLHKMHAYKIHAYKRYAPMRCTPMRYTSMSHPANVFTPPNISHAGRHCVGWHAVVCY